MPLTTAKVKKVLLIYAVCDCRPGAVEMSEMYGFAF